MQNRLLTFFLCGLIALSIAGCRVRPEVKNAVDRDVETANSAMVKAAKPGRSMVRDTVDFKDDIWLGNTTFRVDTGDPLPAKFENDQGITLVSSSTINILEIADQISFLTGIPVRVDDLLKTSLSDISIRDDLDADDSRSDSNSRYAMRVTYSGTLSGLLDTISGRMGIWWRHKNGRITLHSVETREFTIYSLPKSIGGDSSASTGDVDFWDNITSVVESMLPDGSRMIPSQARGTITVSAPPQTLRKIGRYVREVNEKLSRQVAISVKLLQVSLKDDDNYGLDLGAVFESNGLNLVYNGAYTAINRTLGMSLVGATEGTARHWNGSRAIIEALSTMGNVSVVTSSSVTTLNNRVAPVRVGKKYDYISEMEVTNNSGGGEPTVSVSTDSIETGFTMNVLPRILDHGKLLIMFTMSVDELIDMKEVQVGGSVDSSGQQTGGTTMQLPQIETKEFVQEIAMTSGHTLVLSGFEQMTSSYDMRGLGEPGNTIMGGGVNNSRARSVLIVLITPEVLLSPLSPESRLVSDM